MIEPRIEHRSAQTRELSLSEFLSIIRRRKAVVLQALVLVVAVGIVVTLMTTPLYRSSARVLVEGKETMMAQYNANDPLASIFLPPTGHDIATQIEVLQSPSLLDEAYKAVSLPPKGYRLDVKQVADTDVIELNITSPSAEYSKNLAKALPDVYRRYVNRNRKSEVTGALEHARGELKKKTALLMRAERDLERFKQRVGVVDAEAEQSADIAAAAATKADLRKAEADHASARARFDALEAARRRLPAFVETPTTVTNNQQIEALENSIEALRSQRSELLYLYKENDDKVRRVDLQIANLEDRLRRLPKTVTTVSRAPNPALSLYDDRVAEARAALDAARATLTATRSRLDSFDRGKYNAFERVQSDLQRQVQINNDAVTLLAKSVEQLSLKEKATHDPVTTIAPASDAVQVAPKRISNLVLAIVLGLLLGCGMAVLQDFLDDRLSDEEETRRMLGTPVIGHLPLVASENKRLLSLSHPNSRLLESFRMLRSNVQFTLVNRPSRVLLLTSTVPSEGKSSTASNLAVAMALESRRVILIDADLHRPTIDKIFGLARQPGLTNVLVGQSSLAEALQDTDIPNLRVLTAGILPPNPAELLNSPAMDELLESLKSVADTIIFDSPPCLATADAQVLSAKVDGVLYVMQLGKVSKSAVQHSFELLHQAQATILGIVINKMDRSSEQDHYYAYGYYGEDADKRKQEDEEDDDDTDVTALQQHGSRPHRTSSVASNGSGSQPILASMDSLDQTDATDGLSRSGARAQRQRGSDASTDDEA